MTARWPGFLVSILSSLRAHCQGWLQSPMATASLHAVQQCVNSLGLTDLNNQPEEP